MAAGQKREAGARALGRGRPGLSPRAPLPGSRARSHDEQPPSGDRPVLRLALNRGALAIELAEPFAVGPLRLTQMVIRIPGIRFPLDLSGGVARFRHRRGELDSLSVEARPADLSAWAAPRLRGVLGEATPELALSLLASSEREPAASGALVALRAGEAALAFDVVIAPGERDLRLLPERARGVGLGAPPHALALRALLAAVGPAGRLAGGAVVVPDAVAKLVRDALPAAGARAPAVGGVRWGALEELGGGLRVKADVEGAPPALGDRALSALELADLTGAPDQAALAGDLDEARRGYLAALERAPRHPEIASRLAWIDCVVGERAEGALATIVEAMPAVDAGLLGAELLEAVGDRDAARAALERAAHGEAYGPLAALCWLRAARLGEDPGARLGALDQGVARAPLLEALRWARLEARLEVADVRGALADAEHLEAAARGAEARHAVWRRAAAAYLERGYVADARRLFERALRYAPDSPEATLGLAQSLRAAGEGRRALDLLARARALAERRGVAAHGLDLELARGLAELARDRPAAIARVHNVPADAPEALEARLLEGRWRAELGDAAGASLALGRLRAAVELSLTGMGTGGVGFGGERAAQVGALLAEAANIEERERGDLLGAQRYLGLAMRLLPRDRAVTAEFRRVAGELARAAPRPAARPAPQVEVAWAPEPVAAPMDDLVEETASELPDEEPLPEGWDEAEPAVAEAEPAAAEAAAPSEPPEGAGDGIEDEILVERLTERLRGDPGNHETAVALADALARLGRDLDLLALLSARMEEGDDEVRRDFAPRRREVLIRLAAQAREAGRASEAELYEMMLDMP